jgi:hypothetical protein
MSQNQTQNTGTKLYQGGCHCGAVRFEASLDLAAGASRCNCSICQKLGATGGIAKPEAFRLLAGAENRGSYRWGSETSVRYFCKTCGVHCYGEGNLPQLGGAFVSVSYNCLDGVDPHQLPMIYWDGRHNNWQAGPRPTPWPAFPADDRQGVHAA